MTKKQAGIICTLLALIVCTALLATKLNNGGLNDPTDLSAIITTDNVDENKNDYEKNTETISTTDFFYNARSEKEQNDAKLSQNLKAIVDNQNTSQDQKKEASEKLQKIALKQGKESKIELEIKNKGYEDALCEISEDEHKANVIVKAEELSEEEGAVIQEIVQNASGIKEVTIEFKN